VSPCLCGSIFTRRTRPTEKPGRGAKPGISNYSVLHTFTSVPIPAISTATVSPSCR
jgi:hypothetical protein